MSSQMSDERISGYPQPQLYDQHYINKYAYPKGLKCAGRRTDKEEKIKRSLYDMGIPQNIKGFSGWKLTKRPQDTQDLNLFQSGFEKRKKSPTNFPDIGNSFKRGNKKKSNNYKNRMIDDLKVDVNMNNQEEDSPQRNSSLDNKINK